MTDQIRDMAERARRAHQAINDLGAGVTNVKEILMPFDIRDLAVLERALDALEELHDLQAVGDEKIRRCLCQEASAWRGAREVVVSWRRRLGMKVRLLDQT